MIKKIIKIFTIILALLPDDPFIGKLQESFNAIDDYLGYLNYFIPFDLIYDVFDAWCVAIFAYYVYRANREIITKFITHVISSARELFSKFITAIIPGGE